MRTNAQGVLFMFDLNEPIISIIVELIIAIIFLFWGNKSVRLFLTVSGFIGGVTLGRHIVMYAAKAGLFNNSTLSIAVPAILGLIGAILLASMFKFSFVIAGAVVGWKVAEYLMGIFNMEYTYLIPILLAVIGVFLIHSWRNTFIIIATSFLGSALLVDGSVALYYQLKNQPVQDVAIFSNFFGVSQDLIFLVIVVILTLLGYFYQKKHE